VTSGSSGSGGFQQIDLTDKCFSDGTINFKFTTKTNGNTNLEPFIYSTTGANTLLINSVRYTINSDLNILTNTVTNKQFTSIQCYTTELDGKCFNGPNYILVFSKNWFVQVYDGTFSFGVPRSDGYVYTILQNGNIIIEVFNKQLKFQGTNLIDIATNEQYTLTTTCLPRFKQSGASGSPQIPDILVNKCFQGNKYTIRFFNNSLVQVEQKNSFSASPGEYRISQSTVIIKYVASTADLVLNINGTTLSNSEDTLSQINCGSGVTKTSGPGSQISKWVNKCYKTANNNFIYKFQSDGQLMVRNISPGGTLLGATTLWPYLEENPGVLWNIGFAERLIYNDNLDQFTSTFITQSPLTNIPCP
jgi:hypothetical protein